MRNRAFDLGAFCVMVQATPRERSPLRQALVRGLKEYYRGAYGYDRYGAETILHLSEALREPYIFGYAAVQVLRERRLSEATRAAVARYTLDNADYGSDTGLPFGMYAALEFLQRRDLLPAPDLRYALVLSAGEYDPFRGMEKPAMVGFFGNLMSNPEMPPVERAFWGHSLLARHQDGGGAAVLATLLLSHEEIPAAIRHELCHAWLNFRQPRLEVEIPPPTGSNGEFISQHMPFWVAYAPSWPSPEMVRLALPWLVRLGDDPGDTAEAYIGYRESFGEHVQQGVLDVLTEHRDRIPAERLRPLIESGIAASASLAVRRRLYSFGTDVFGRDYLERASADNAASVRRWATRQLQESV